MSTKSGRPAPYEAELAESAAIMAEISTLARHLPRILMPLSGMIDSFTADIDPKKQGALLEFFEFAKAEFSDDGYATLQRHHLSPAALRSIKALGYISPEHKYIDFPYWARSKFAIGRQINLPEAAGKSILDIGAGPGHFGVVARYFGCRYEGVEVPLVPWVEHTDRHLFDDLCGFFGVSRTTHAIRPYEPLKVDGRFDLLTCQMGNFCSALDENRKRRPWEWAEWVYLLENLVSDVMAPEFRMYFQIGRDYLPPDVVANVRRVALTFDDAKCAFTFDQTLDMGALVGV